MKRWIPLFLFVSCSLGGKPVTMDAFYEVDISTPTPQVIALLGQPYAIHKKEDGTLEYEYIERIKIGSRDAETRRYFILIKNGAVVSKRVEGSTPLPYGFDSYEMQTTERAEE